MCCPVILEPAQPSERCCNLFNNKRDTEMTSKRILYVNFNAETLIRDERMLMQAGYAVDTVFGLDGLLACGSIAEYTSISIDEACPLQEREKLLSWLKANFPRLSILPAA